jgi:hypothetical protein
MKINELLMNLHRSDGFFNHAMHGLQTNILTQECSPLRGQNSCAYILREFTQNSLSVSGLNQSFR